jgi:WD40 repeat protein
MNANKYHRLLSNYFNQKNYFHASFRELNKNEKKWKPLIRRVNTRKISELPWQLIRSNQWDKLEKLFLSLDFLEAKTEGGFVFYLIHDFVETITLLDSKRSNHKLLRLLLEAIRRDVHFIAKQPTVLFQCLWNTCWWFDNPESEKYYDVVLERAPWNQAGNKLYQLLESFKVNKVNESNSIGWICSLIPPAIHLDHGQIHVLEGHSKKVNTVAFSPNSQTVISGSEDESLRIWDIETGRCVLHLDGHTGPITRVSWGSSDSEIISSSLDKSIKYWNCKSGKVNKEIKFSGPVNHMEYIPATGVLLAVISESTLILRNVKNEDDQLTIPFLDKILYIAYSPDGHNIATATYTNIRIFDINSGKELSTIHEANAKTINYSPDGRFLIINGSLLNFWALPDLGYAIGLEDELSNPHYSTIALSPDSKNLAGAGRYGFIEISKWEDYFDLSPEHTKSNFCGHEGPINHLAYSPNGKLLASASDDCSIRIWDASEKSFLNLKINEPYDLDPYAKNDIMKISWSINGNRLLAVFENYAYSIWSQVDGIERFPSSYWPLSFNGSLINISISNDGEQAIAVDSSGIVHIWETFYGDEIYHFKFEKGKVNSCSFIEFDHWAIISYNDGKQNYWNLEKNVVETELPNEIQFENIHEPIKLPIKISKTTDLGIEFIDEQDQTPMAWFPKKLNHIAQNPTSAIWAGAISADLYIIKFVNKFI